MRKIMLLLAGLLLMGLVGCESEADKQAQVLSQQHHLFNIQQCEAESKPNTIDVPGVMTRNDSYRALVLNCMTHTEHTDLPPAFVHVRIRQLSAAPSRV
jgi:hypothetical protein